MIIKGFWLKICFMNIKYDNPLIIDTFLQVFKECLEFCVDGRLGRFDNGLHIGFLLFNRMVSSVQEHTSSVAISTLPFVPELDSRIHG